MKFDAKKSEFLRTHREVLRVVDGDGFLVIDKMKKKQEEIRLLGIDAPELKHCKKLKQDERETHLPAQLLIELGRQSLNFLLKVAPVGTNITLCTEQKNSTDPYGRILAYAYLPDGTCINEMMIQQGLAKPYSKYFCSALSHFQILNTFARQKKLGHYSRVKNF